MSFSPDSLAAALQQQPAPRRWVVAYSGGLDSSVLLHALAQLAPAIPCCALHINHRLAAQSDQWQQHCAAACARWRIDFFAVTVAVTPAGEGPEAAARHARYAAFEQFLQAGDCLLQAHHLDDQAETLLLRLLRGSGPRGLAGIRPQRNLGRGTLLRPLLAWRRDQLHDYARERGLDWIEDGSNADTRFDRNYLRHSVLPLLAARWPDYRQRLDQTAALCAATERLNRDQAEADLAALQPRGERLGQSIDLPQLRAWPGYRRHNVLRHWFASQQLSTPALVHLQQVEQQLLDVRASAAAAVAWGELEVRSYGERLYCLPSLPAPADRVLQWCPDTVLLLPDGGLLAASSATGGAGRLRPVSRVEVRRRRGGERCRPHDRGHSQTLKKLLQERRLEPWLRDRVPLIYVDGKLAAVGDLWVCRGFVAEAGEPGLELDWRFD
ncbi:tRNA lysidine(34) synthetase TilS [Exilibacterium tricleocarpae]|uniref:tRNA lysidine(34) synthetase TilS n=1 Tax=Exilibacterium tricleocarpae TaxID=2591008 RepID=UPI003CCC4DCF